MAKKTQIQKFREAARAHEADESEERFDETLKKLAETPRKTDATKDEKAKPKP